MIKVSNGRCVRHLGLRAMKTAKTRNIVAVLAIALTTILFTSIFTIAASINYSYQQENFRRMGGDCHGAVKYITWEQVEELRTDPLIEDSFARLFVGLLTEPPFQKTHVEVSYIEPNGAPHYFCEPVEGRLPQEGTDEMATDTHVLALLGVEPKVGAKIALPVTIDCGAGGNKIVERTFTLSGWWEYDSAVIANHVLLPLSGAQELLTLSGAQELDKLPGGDFMCITGTWNLDVMFKNALNIRQNLETVLENHGYQNEEPGKEDYLDIGVSWAHTASRFTDVFDLSGVIAIAAVLLLIIFTGYLIIYNVFQISVTNDIRFYGLLKTIGTTPRQIKQIVRQQALLLSCFGIPLGLLLGFVIGNVLTPVIMARMSYKNAFVSFNPWIFLGAAAFSLVTVFLSCARPGRMAARVSAVEAVRYTEGAQNPKRASGRVSVKKAVGGASLPQMAWANLGRSRSKTVVTVVSLTLAVVLMTLTYTFTSGFDLEKYLSSSVCTDFVVGHADQFAVASGGGFRSSANAVPEDLIADIDAQSGITESGRVYGLSWNVQEFVTQDWLRQGWLRLGEEAAQMQVDWAEHLPDGRVTASAMLYGMEDFPLSKLNVIEGDLEPLKDPTQNAIAAVGDVDDYGNFLPDTAWARVGDTVTLRYVSEWMYIDRVTGEELSSEEVNARYSRLEQDTFSRLPKIYEQKDYTVCALVTVPGTLSFRYGLVGGDDYVLGAEQFKQDTGTDLIMIYPYNVAEESNAAMEGFLADYTETVQPDFDYESKQTYMDEFEGFRSMFLTLGGALSFIIGLVGVLNFINAVLTGIMTRKREFAVLQSVGMTGKQLKTMLVCEGLYYTILALTLSLALSLVLGPLAGNALSRLFWFFTYRFTVLPVALTLPVFLLLGVAVPLTVYRSIARSTIVERLREAEG